MVLIAMLLLASPMPSTTPTPVPSPIVTPASPQLVSWALRQRHRAQRARVRVAFADRCMGVRGPLALKASPARSSDQVEWQAAAAAWKMQAKAYTHTLALRVAKMKHPGGAASGTKWLKLAAYVGWPLSTWHTLAALIWNESSGIPWEPNQQGSGCTGLLQLAPCWWAGKFDPRDPEANLREGLRIWRSQHDSFLPAWQGDPAVGW